MFYRIVVKQLEFSRPVEQMRSCEKPNRIWTVVLENCTKGTTTNNHPKENRNYLFRCLGIKHPDKRNKL